MALWRNRDNWTQRQSTIRFPVLQMTRRAVLAGLAGLGLARAARGQSPESALDSRQLKITFAAFLDTLIPADETPSATALGIDRLLLAEAVGRTNYPELLAEGTAWLESEAAAAGLAHFAAAADAVRERIVASAFAAEQGTLPRVFAEFMRQDAMRLYYAQPGSWPGMIDGPPQPLGYLSVDLPPERKR